MIELLPPELKPLFEARRPFIVERAIDPDLWRNVGWEEEPPNHFLDMDHEAFGPYPFNGLPRDYADAVQKFGREFIHTQGLLPWRTAEFFGRLQREFESLETPASRPATRQTTSCCLRPSSPTTCLMVTCRCMRW